MMSIGGWELPALSPCTLLWYEAQFLAFEDFEGNFLNSSLRPCFKKLFDVVQMYGKDVQAAGSSRGTSKFLLDVARQNAEMTINLQRTILNNKQRR